MGIFRIKYKMPAMSSVPKLTPRVVCISVRASWHMPIRPPVYIFIGTMNSFWATAAINSPNTAATRRIQRLCRVL